MNSYTEQITCQSFIWTIPNSVFRQATGNPDSKFFMITLFSLCKQMSLINTMHRPGVVLRKIRLLSRPKLLLTFPHISPLNLIQSQPNSVHILKPVLSQPFKIHRSTPTQTLMLAVQLLRILPARVGAYLETGTKDDRNNGGGRYPRIGIAVSTFPDENS